MDLSAFLAENAVQVENVKYIVSERFLDPQGNPVPWEIRCLTSAEDEALRKLCIRRVPVEGKRSQFTSELDLELYAGKLAAACTVFPNLNDRALQDSYRVMGAENLLKTMLTAGEYDGYLEKIQQVCGFGQGIQEEVEQAKN